MHWPSKLRARRVQARRSRSSDLRYRNSSLRRLILSWVINVVSTLLVRFQICSLVQLRNTNGWPVFSYSYRQYHGCHRNCCGASRIGNCLHIGLYSPRSPRIVCRCYGCILIDVIFNLILDLIAYVSLCILSFIRWTSHCVAFLHGQYHWMLSQRLNYLIAEISLES
jgi:hypothetical protein